jgi:hypothetical protein
VVWESFPEQAKWRPTGRVGGGQRRIRRGSRSFCIWGDVGKQDTIHSLVLLLPSFYRLPAFSFHGGGGRTGPCLLARKRMGLCGGGEVCPSFDHSELTRRTEASMCLTSCLCNFWSARVPAASLGHLHSQKVSHTVSLGHGQPGPHLSQAELWEPATEASEKEDGQEMRVRL